ncbi:MAG: hypothetical protein JWO73_720 [Candidatus Taylorbacteria bacterium]|nr:hypothetical protein [Candidatus Taylorbacteria bacterium]
MKLSPVIYVARDIERALGMEPGANALCNYFIITNRTPYAEKIQAKYPDNVWLIDRPVAAGEAAGIETETLGTYELLSIPEVAASITKSTKDEGAKLVVFKNAPRIEALAKKHGWQLVNPPAALAEKIENKITQVEFLGELVSYLPAHQILQTKHIKPTYRNTSGELDAVKDEFIPFIIQWAHSHTGDGTILVTNEKQLQEIQQKFPDRDARVSVFVKGPTFTSNVLPLLAGEANISYQITGSLPFTDNPWSTIGNDWSLTHSILTEKNVATIHEIAQKTAEKMKAAGWRGLFGIDLIYDEERDEIRLIEINARQPASTTFESQLQLGLRVAGLEGVTTFEAHLASLEGGGTVQPLIPVYDGAQIIQRVTASKKSVSDKAAKELDEAGFITIQYPNTKPNADLIRIQNLRGIMETHTKFNLRGKKIVEIITK